MKKIIMISILIMVFFSLIGCGNDDGISETMSGEGEYWEVEFTFVEDENSYNYILRYKGDVEDLTPDENIRIGSLWLHQDAELIVEAAQEESLADMILNESTEALNDMIEFQGDRSEGYSTYGLNILDGSINTIIHNNGELKRSHVFLEKDQEYVGSSFYFAVNWDDNSESFIVD